MDSRRERAFCAGLKCAFVKHPQEENLTWETMRYPGARQLLNAFPFRSLGFCLAIELRADFWIVESDMHNQSPRAIREDPTGLARLRSAQRGIVPQHKVPWDDYDIIISCDPVVKSTIVAKHPDILWAYREIASRCGRARLAVHERKPCAGYDLFLDYYLEPKRRLKFLPQPVGFPFMQNPDTLRRLIGPVHEPAVFIDTRHVPRDKRRQNDIAIEFHRLSGLPLRHVVMKKRVTEPIRFFTELTSGGILPLKEYLSLMGSCKYFLIYRGGRRGEWNITGEAVLEAAAIGSIVIANENSLVHRDLCHPFCLIPAGGPPRIGLRKIKKIENDEALQAEILAHQEKVVWSKHWREPLETLLLALEMKHQNC